LNRNWRCAAFADKPEGGADRGRHGFLTHARSIVANAELAASQVRAIGQGMTGALNVATTGSMLLGPLAALMADYQRRVPAC